MGKQGLGGLLQGYRRVPRASGQMAWEAPPLLTANDAVSLALPSPRDRKLYHPWLYTRGCCPVMARLLAAFSDENRSVSCSTCSTIKMPAPVARILVPRPLRSSIWIKTQATWWWGRAGRWRFF